MRMNAARSFFRLWVPFTLVLMLASVWVVPPLLAQFNINTIIQIDAPVGQSPSFAARGLDANIGMHFVPKGTGTLFLDGPVTVLGLLTASGGQSFGGVARTIFLNANDVCFSDNANLIRVRLATGDWAIARTAAGAETFNVECSFGWATSLTAGKGVRLDSFSLVEQITVVALTSHTFQGLSTTSYVNNVANAVAGYGGVITVTPPTATQANPYVTPATIGTPAFMNSTATQIVIDQQVVMANTGVYRLYGIVANFTNAIY